MSANAANGRLRCRACGTEAAEGDRFCGTCGVLIPVPAATPTRAKHPNRFVFVAFVVVVIAALGFAGTVRSSARRDADERRALAINLPILRESADDIAKRLDALDGSPSALWSRDDLVSAGMDVPGADTEARWPTLARPIDRLRRAVEALSGLPRDSSEAKKWGAGDLSGSKASLVSECRAALGAYRASLAELERSGGRR